MGDTVGGATLSTALAQTKYHGSVACVGVAGGGVLDGTVYPFILRGIRLLGVDSTMPWNVEGFETDRASWEAYRRQRMLIWERLEADLTIEALKMMHSETTTLDGIPDSSERLLRG